MMHFLLSLVLLVSFSYLQSKASYENEKEDSEVKTGKPPLAIRVSVTPPGTYSPRPYEVDERDINREDVLRQRAVDFVQAEGAGSPSSTPTLHSQAQDAHGRHTLSDGSDNGGVQSVQTGGTEYNSGIPPVAPRHQTFMDVSGEGQQNVVPPVIVVRQPAKPSWFRKYCCCCCRKR